MGFENFWLPKKESTRLQDQEISDALNKREEQESKQNIDGLVSTKDIFEEMGVNLEKVYEWYVAAISKRSREPLELDRFVSHFEGYSFEPTYAYGDIEKGFLLGYTKFGVFIPTHFAPRSMRGGYDLMTELGESDKIPAVLAITEDLKETLKKIPTWNVLDLDFLSYFRESEIKKILFIILIQM